MPPSNSPVSELQRGDQPGRARPARDVARAVAVQAGDVTLVGEVVDVQLQAQVRAELPGHEGVQRKGLGVAFVDLAGIAAVLARDRIADAGIVEIGGRQGACARTRNPRRP